VRSLIEVLLWTVAAPLLVLWLIGFAVHLDRDWQFILAAPLSLAGLFIAVKRING
jgi:hypothetical protein